MKKLILICIILLAFTFGQVTQSWIREAWARITTSATSITGDGAINITSGGAGTIQLDSATGTINMVDNLQVSHASSPQITVIDSTGGAASLRMVAFDADAKIGTESNHPLALRTNALDRITISTSGNVGIGGALALGSTSQTATHINQKLIGNPQASLSFRRSAASDTDANATFMIGVDDLLGAGGSPILVIGLNASGPESLPRNVTNWIRLDTSGNVDFSVALAKTEIPSATAYEDEANTFSSNQLVQSATNPEWKAIDTTNSAGVHLVALDSEARVGTTTAHDFSIERNGTPVLTVTTSGMSNTGTYQSTKSCASGFTRVTGPGNYCKRNSTTSPSWTDATTCTAHTGTSLGVALPSDAKFINLQILWRAISNNATGARTNEVFFWNDSSCLNLLSYSVHTSYEFSAVAAGSGIGNSSDHVIIPLVSTDTFYATQTNAGGNGNAEILTVKMEGYWD